MTVKDKILKELGTGEKQVSAIAQTLGIKQGHVKTVLYRMRETGQVIKNDTDNGVTWKLPDPATPVSQVQTEEVKAESVPVAEEKIVPAPQDQPVPQPIKRKALQPKRVGGRKWWLVGIGAITIAVGIAGLVAFGQSRNMILGLATVMVIIGGGGCVYFGLKKQDEGVVLTKNGKVNKAPANALNIYPNKLVFEWVDEALLKGQPQKCRNDNRYYHVHIDGSAWGAKQEGLMCFALPDTQYRDPREFANNINIPAHRRLAQRKASLLEKVTPFALLIAMFIVAILIIASGSPAQGA